MGNMGKGLEASYMFEERKTEIMCFGLAHNWSLCRLCFVVDVCHILMVTLTMEISTIL